MRYRSGPHRKGRERMSFKYIQDNYGVPAKRGQRVRSGGKLGTITSAMNQYINIRWDGDKNPRGPYHPTHEIEYITEEAQELASASQGDQPTPQEKGDSNG